MKVINLFRNKYFIFSSILLNLYFVLFPTDKIHTPDSIAKPDSLLMDDNISDDFDSFEKITADYLDARKSLNLSVLGKYLYLNEAAPSRRSKEYKILVWKHGSFLERRHIFYFGSTRHEPFADCSVHNCKLTYEDSALAEADAVVFQLHKTAGVDKLPDLNTSRPAGQRWVFVSDESPRHTFLYVNNFWFKYADIFNWSMTYRAEADIPVAYGRTVPLDQELQLDDALDFAGRFQALVPNARSKRRDVLAAAMISNCVQDRVMYVKELQKHMTVHFYGNCGGDKRMKSACPGSYGSDCPILDRYLFYLGFENSRCDEYITEKTFNHAYKKGSVPVILGVKNVAARRLLPPNSFLNVLDFQSPEDLARRILYINSTLEQNYLQFHEWRRWFKVLNEHGYMGQPSYHYCRLCEALNYNDESPKVYGRLELARFLDPNPNCY